MADAPYTDWDDTDASNTAIDGSDISEGCTPGGLNNALRAWRGSLARLLHSWTGQKVTGGTANVQTLTSGLSLSGTPEALVVFTAGSGLTNTGACTLTVDSMDAKSVKVSGADGSLDDPAAGAISAGAVHLVSYEATAGVWVLLNPAVGSLLASYLLLAGGTMSGTLAMADNLITRPKFTDYAETLSAHGSSGGGTEDFDCAVANVHSVTVDTSANTFTFSNPPASGSAGSLTLIITNGGSQTVNWPASVDWQGGNAPTLTTSGVDVLTFLTVDGGTIWYGFPAGLDMG